MKKLLLSTLAATSIFVSGALLADTRIDHFEALPSNTLEEAVKNFSEYNQKLATILAGEIDNQAMTDIHQLTYTLENALEKIHEEVTALVDTLEELHVASETYQPEAVKEHGAAYMEVASKIAH